MLQSHCEEIRGTWSQCILRTWANWSLYHQLEGSAQDCGNASALAMESPQSHYTDFIMSTMASQITGVCIVCSTVCSGADQRKHHSPAPLTFVKGMHQWPVNSPHKGPVTQKMLPFDDVIMLMQNHRYDCLNWKPWHRTWCHESVHFVLLEPCAADTRISGITGLIPWLLIPRIFASSAALISIALVKDCSFHFSLTLSRRFWLDNGSLSTRNKYLKLHLNVQKW